MAKTTKPVAVLLAGATASGKSALATALAEQLQGELVCADALQLYRALPLLTASPSAAEKKRVPHHLYQSQEAQYNVGSWQAAAWAHIQDIHTRGHLPIVVGGTGLYFQSLTAGLADIPAIPDSLRAELQEELAEQGAQTLWQQLAPADKEKIQAQDGQRIVRALAVWRHTNISLQEWQKNTTALPAKWIKLCLQPAREWLHERIAERWQALLQAGVVQEVEQWLAQDPSKDSPLWQAVGVRPLVAHLRQETTLEEASALAITQTRQYAKRQTTWARRYMQDWESLTEQQYIKKTAKIVAFIAKNI